jgi:GntR family transcriptional regulator/MocR family aminotransferase
MRNARGVNCVPEQVIALSGVESALDLVARVMIDPGHAVYLHDPAADMVRSIFLAAGARLYALPPEDRVAEFSSASCPPPRLIFVSPSVSFPFGRQMREVRRAAVLERAKAFGAAVLEADTYGELVYTGGRLPALQALDEDGRVFYFGSFNRTLGPGVRLSYLIVPTALADAFAEMARRHAYGADIFLQRAVATYVADGDYALHVRTIRGIYAERLGLLVEACRSHIGAARVLEPDGGLHLAILLDDEEDEHLVCRLAARDTLALTPLSHFYLSAAQRRYGLVLGFGSLPDRAIDTAVRCLARLIAEARTLRLDGTFTLLAR